MNLQKENDLISMGLTQISASVNYVGILSEKEFWTPWHDENGDFLVKDGEILYWNIRSIHYDDGKGYIVNFDTGENVERHLGKLKKDFERMLYLCSPESGFDTRTYASFSGNGDWEEKALDEISRVEKRIELLKRRQQN